MTPTLMIYGVTGFTGGLIAREARRQGLSFLAAGRTEAGVKAEADSLQVPFRCFGLEDPQRLEEGLAGVTVLLNTAGPFDRTQGPLLAACLRLGIHYLDLAGEVPAFETALGADAEAQAKGIQVMPGVGFGVVPTDALAVLLRRRLPEGNHLRLAFETRGGVSRGTLGALLKDLNRSGWKRRNGKLVPAEAFEATLPVDFGTHRQGVATNPWRADLVSAAHSTGIPNIDTYAVFPGILRLLRRSPLLRRLFQRLLPRLPEGPSEKAMAQGRTWVWGELSQGSQRKVARLTGPEAYRFTALSAVAVARKVLDGDLKPGFQTPAGAYGAEWVLELPGVSLV